MPREFNVPPFYRSSSIAAVKSSRREEDPRKKDLTPSILDFGQVRFKIARHFGFCFGVENAIEIAYRTLEENPDKRIFLVSEMIHNPEVNGDLEARGVKFLLDTSGKPLIPLNTLNPEDIVIVPAFGTTVELQKELSDRGINVYYHDTTCPFVEKVWKRAADLGKQDFTVIVHGKRTHEETRATFSHSKQTAPTLVVLNLAEAELVAQFMRGKLSLEDFKANFVNAMSDGFDPEKHLTRVGVINQTTMLATETKAIAKLIRDCLVEINGEENIRKYFADTRDTLCYATYENQSATRALIDSGIDMAVVVGGYNSSNTSHLVELCEEVAPTFYIKNAHEIINEHTIKHFDLHSKSVIETINWLPEKRPLDIALTSGASCPDRIVDEVLQKIISLFPGTLPLEIALEPFQTHLLT